MSQQTVTVIPPPAEQPTRLVGIFRAFIVVGVVTFLGGLVAGYSERIWISYLVNFCFWTGLAQGGIAFSAAYRLTNGSWGDTIRRVAEGFVLFVPFSVLLFLVTALGRTTLWPWIEDPIPAKAAWLNEPFFFLRVTMYFAFLSALSLWYVYRSVRPELGLLSERGQLPHSRWNDRLLRNWKGYATEVEESKKSLTTLAPGLVLAYATVYSFVGFDVVMSLDPHWYSTIYGWLYFVHAFNAAVAATIIIAILARRYFDLRDHVSMKQFYDVSRLLMGICMLAGGFYWSQYLVIWYGNLGEEIERLITRFFHAPWPPVQWAVIVSVYFFPIVVFLSRAIKERPRALIVIAFMILLGNWFYHFIEIAPAVWHNESLPLGVADVGIALGFLGAFGLSWLAYARRVPLVGPTVTKK